uniref:Uncharacterized protein n=1 Tax=viral metagenome TaxID=1070528 RepID=A0A6C0LTC3_9ZZZZ
MFGVENSQNLQEISPAGSDISPMTGIMSFDPSNESQWSSPFENKIYTTEEKKPPFANYYASDLSDKLLRKEMQNKHLNKTIDLVAEYQEPIFRTVNRVVRKKTNVNKEVIILLILLAVILLIWKWYVSHK